MKKNFTLIELLMVAGNVSTVKMPGDEYDVDITGYEIPIVFKACKRD